MRPNHLHYFIIPSLFILLLISCSNPKEDSQKQDHFWKNYDKYASSDRTIDPGEYIDYLRKTKFTHGELDSFPQYAIILHDTRVPDYLDSLGFDSTEIRTLQTGTTDPNLIYIIRSKRMHVNFAISPGLPGTGGVTTQIAELGALGVKYVVHIGTAGILGDQISDNTLIVSKGCYKDGGAALLTNTSKESCSEIIFSDTSFSALLFHEAEKEQVKSIQQFGFTVPVFYYQPKSIFYKLLKGETSSTPPQYVEMEGAGVFAISGLMNIHAASLVAGTDRYVLKNDSVTHTFMNYDADRLKLQAVKITLHVYEKLQNQTSSLNPY